jgi:uncharacterized membrane protein (DUF2068 family)
MIPPRRPHHQGRGLLLIAAFKFLKGLGLLALGFGELHFLHRDLAATIAHWVNLLRIDPHSHYLLWLLQRIAHVDEKRFRELSVGTFFYAALFLFEGTGLALRKRWAEYLTILSTSALIPVELYEIYRGPSLVKVLLLVVNLAIVAYLVRELRRTRSPRPVAN